MYKRIDLSIEKVMDDHNYILKHKDKKDHYVLYIKGLEFYDIDYIPNEGDRINMSEELLDSDSNTYEVNLKFEYLENSIEENIEFKEYDVIKVTSEDKEMYFKRMID